ncbi:MAG: 50S ribosome-binding GTPase [Alphaproteobacteria bacterium]|nr:50S ribosome-binding GTPase [Alphaproteobacteria bacterium]
MEPFEVIAAVRPWLEPDELVAWRDGRETRWLLVGRTSCGKTSLRNALLGRSDPVGLGGVTRAFDRAARGRDVWIDTPGIDGRDTAIDTLGPGFDEADVVVWVVDGLQPLTRTERDVVELLLPKGTPLACVVSKADLLEDEVDAVLERVRTNTLHLEPYRIEAGDLRTYAPDLSGHPRSPRQKRALAEALDAVRERFARSERPVSPEELRALTDIRPAVLDWMSRWTTHTERMKVTELVADFTDALDALRNDVLVRLAAHPALSPHLPRLAELPSPPGETEGLLATLRMNAAGRTAALRELRGYAAAWMAEAQILLSDWAESVPTDAEAAARWQRAAQALERAEV